MYAIPLKLEQVFLENWLFHRICVEYTAFATSMINSGIWTLDAINIVKIVFEEMDRVEY